MSLPHLKHRAQAYGGLLAHYRAVFAAHWARRNDRSLGLFNEDEAEFLPAALALQERPVSSTARWTARVLMTLVAAVLAWSIGEALMRGKASMLGAASGAVAGLVAITPAAGNVGLMGAIIVGLVAGFAGLWGVHGVCGIVGALLTGILNNQALGGPGMVTDWVTGTVGSNGYGAQFLIQAKAVGVTIIWSGVVAAVSFKIVDLVIGLRVTEEEEREGLDITAHGETAYSK